MPNAAPFTYWYLQLPNWILLAMMLLLLVRLVLSPVLGHSSGIMRPLMAITRPVAATIGAVTPRIVPPAGVLVCAIIWLAAARVLVLMAALALGVRL
jgi:hypothetical protein